MAHESWLVASTYFLEASLSPISMKIPHQLYDEHCFVLLIFFCFIWWCWWLHDRDDHDYHEDDDDDDNDSVANVNFVSRSQESYLVCVIYIYACHIETIKIFENHQPSTQV